MDSIHPSLHPKLKDFSYLYSFGNLVETNEMAIEFLEEIGLVPSKSSTPPECCGLPMKVEINAEKKLGWVWRCSTKGGRKKGAKLCRASVNPCHGTFFDGSSCRIQIGDVLAIIICFVTKMKVSQLFRNLKSMRRHCGENESSWSTVIDYYSYCREIAEVIASHDKNILGGEGKSVQIDETFLTKRKYHRGRITEQMTTTVLGLYCKEDKVGLFFKVNSKSKADLWPFISKYVAKDTSRICTDTAKQYVGVEKLFGEDTVHLATNHSIGEYVSKDDPTNTINDLENQNKLLKKSIICRRTTTHLHQYMALHYYRQQHLEKVYKNDDGSQIMTFLLDIKKVYPGIVDGKQIPGLELLEIDPPTVESEGLEEVVPLKRPRLASIDEEIEEAVEESDDDEADPDFIF